jgi:hypothetical protein
MTGYILKRLLSAIPVLLGHLDHRLPDHGDDPRRPGHRDPRLLRDAGKRGR